MNNEYYYIHYSEYYYLPYSLPFKEPALFMQQSKNDNKKHVISLMARESLAYVINL